MSDVHLLQTEITYLKGVGPQRGKVLNEEFGIYTFQDLLDFYPFRYVDKSQINAIKEIKDADSYYQIQGIIVDKSSIGKGKTKKLSAILEDQNGDQVVLRWFQGINWIEDKIVIGSKYIIFGKPILFGNKFSFNHPEFNLLTNENLNQTGLFPVYHSSEKATANGLNSKGIAKLTETLLERISSVIPENLTQSIIAKYNLFNRKDSYRFIHFPPNEAYQQKAAARFKFEEFFFTQLSIIKIRLNRKNKSVGHQFSKVGTLFNSFYHNHLPFELTNAQKKVIKEIRFDMGQTYQMNRLLQGDVGSGKTLVALMAMLIAADNGFQSALMAPTEILANQHFNTISNLLKLLPVNIALLTGSTSTSDRKIIHENLQNGELHIIIGTHALIEDTVKFSNLGFVVIDEQHRFGVAQRAKLWSKNTIPPDILVMTATPIPRTMAMTLYGDLDYSVINEMPIGRIPVKTYHFTEAKRLKVFDFIKKTIALGQQVYIVYPLIEESETLDLKNLIEGYEAISRSFPLPDYRLSIVHGKMDPSAKEYEMKLFSEGKTHILVSTTVIEVGVDVPNATLMVIENANRFGLSQLHQLRGRVGRGKEQSYCFLMSEGKLSKEAKTRLETMVRTNNGFEIANMDLKLRGPGELGGTKQSGLLNLKLADIAVDENILRAARNSAETILSNDPNLLLQENLPIRQHLVQNQKSSFDWSKIS
ncbi:MAG: ATP-dependent DNA helicase RecG [Bacteroidales bacterium]|nr:ATP-dependent DNA helicase RecG [Bacteroidales bacterium]